MITVTPDAGFKSIIIIPTTELSIETCIIRDDQSNIEEELIIDDVIVGEYYTTIVIDFPELIENHIYDFSILNDLYQWVYHDRLLATSQNAPEFSLNKNPQKYKSNITTNEFITYG